jgi:prepilin-type processing-associated H-X9-DG protein
MRIYSDTDVKHQFYFNVLYFDGIRDIKKMVLVETQNKDLGFAESKVKRYYRDVVINTITLDFYKKI